MSWIGWLAGVEKYNVVTMPARLQDYQYTLTLHSDKHSDKVLSIYHGKRAPFYWKITIQREQENWPSFPWKKGPIFVL